MNMADERSLADLDPNAARKAAKTEIELSKESDAPIAEQLKGEGPLSGR